MRFLIFGALLFAADRGGRAALPPAAEPPVVIGAARLEALRAEALARSGRLPSPAELRALAEAEADDELLLREAFALGLQRGDGVVRRRLARNLRFLGADPQRSDADLHAEALALGMHESDLVVRRRLVQRMQLLVHEAARAQEPGEDELRRFFEAGRARWPEAEALGPVRNQVRYALLAERGDAALRRALAELRARTAVRIEGMGEAEAR
jgi:hypothetical protein